MYTELKEERLKQKVLKNLIIRENIRNSFILIRPIKYMINEKYIIIIYLKISCSSNGYLHIDIAYVIYRKPFEYLNFVNGSSYDFLGSHIFFPNKYKHKFKKATFKTAIEFSFLRESFYDLKYDFDCDTSKKAEFITIDDVLAVL